MNRTTVSVVVNTLNRSESLARTLASLQLLKGDEFEIEVVVVEGPSTDDTGQLLDSYGSRVRRVSVAEANLSASRNVGIRAAAGSLVAFLDDDAVADPYWLEQLVPAFDDPYLGAAGGPALAMQGDADVFGNVTNCLGEAEVYNRGAAFLNAPDGTWMAYPIGTNLLLRRSSVVAVGGFDEEIEYYHDETDVCRRLLDRGYDVRILARGAVHHGLLASDRRSAAGVFRTRRSIVKNSVYFALRHGPRRHSYEHVARALVRLADQEAALHAHHRAVGLAIESDVERHRFEAQDAIDDAFSAASRPPRTRPTSWFASTEAFGAFERQPHAQARHIALICRWFDLDPENGIPRSYADIAAALAARGHVVRVVAEGVERELELRGQVFVHRVASAPLTAPADSDAWCAAAKREVERLAAIAPFDLVIGPNWDFEPLLLVDGPVPVVVTLHTPLATVLACDDEFRRSLAGADGRLSAEARCVAGATYLLCASPEIVTTVADAGAQIADRAVVIPRGLPDRPPAPCTRSVEAPMVLFVGRIEPRKGIDALFRAIPDVIRRHPAVRFRFVGDTSRRRSDGVRFVDSFAARHPGLVAAAPGRSPSVEFCGRVDEPTLLADYAAASIVVVPSRYESFGRVAVEAMRAGTPVVACAAAGGLSGLIDHEQNGLLVPVDDPLSLAVAICRLLGDEALRSRLGDTARQKYLTHWTHDRMADALHAAVLDWVPVRRADEVG